MSQIETHAWQPGAQPRPIRAGIFSSVTRAEEAIQGLRAAGFPSDEITVVCSREEQRDHFRKFLRQDPAGAHAPAAAITGGAVGAALASVVVLGAATLVASPLVLAIGGPSIWASGVLGGLVGAMMTRGVDKELADFYHQAVQDGKLLVAVEVAPEHEHQTELHEAERILSAAGAEPIALSQQ